MHKFIYLIIFQEKCWHLYLPELTSNCIFNFIVLNLDFELPKFKKEKQLYLEFLQASTAKLFILRHAYSNIQYALIWVNHLSDYIECIYPNKLPGPIVKCNK